jgi:hypothetical protein
MSKKDKVQIRKAIINHGGIQFTFELGMHFNGDNLLEISKLEYKKYVLSIYAHKKLLCSFFDCPIYVEYA